MPDRHVMIITSVLPPKFHGGTPRLLRWCRVLPELGWRVSLCGFGGHTHLMDQDPVPPGVEVTSVDVGRPIDRARAKAGVLAGGGGAKAMLGRAATAILGASGEDDFPDEMIHHMDRLQEAAVSAIRRTKPDIVMITVPSFSLMRREFLAAIQGVAPGRVVLDVRDMFAENEHWAGDAGREKAAKYWETVALGLVDGVAGVSEGIERHFAEAWAVKDSAAVTNSFDGKAIVRSGVAWPGLPSSEFRLLFAGMAYGAQAPKLLIPAIRQAAKAEPELQTHLRLVFAGLEQDGSFGDWTEFGDIVQRLGQVPYSKIPRLIADADVLLLVIAKRKRIDAVPGAKVFEYLGARRPILALTTGAAAQLVEECEAGVACDPTDVAATANAVLRLYRAWKSGDPWRFGPIESVERFETRNVARELIDLFDKVTSKGP